MKNNTIAYLNTKIWHRLLKVIYILIFISVSVYAVMLSIEEYSPHEALDYSKSLIICDNGETYTFSEARNVDDDIAMEKLCLSPAEKTRREVFLDYQAFLEREKMGIPHPEYEEIPLNYKIQKVYKTIGGWYLVFGYSILWILIIYVALEITKRAFYYIVLGKINPPKK